MSNVDIVNLPAVTTIGDTDLLMDFVISAGSSAVKKITGANFKASILAGYTGSNSIVTTGIISAGTWQATPIADSYIASAATWNAKQPALPSISGQSGKVLGNNGTAISWVAVGGATIANTTNLIAGDGAGNGVDSGKAVSAIGAPTTSIASGTKSLAVTANGIQAKDTALTAPNALGADATDLQTARNAATMTASGKGSVIAGGERNTCIGTWSTIAGGFSNTNNGDTCAMGGGNANVTNGSYTTIAGGDQNQTNGNWTYVPGGKQANADRYGMGAWAAGVFAAVGDAQAVEFVMRQATTDATPAELFLDGVSTQLTLDEGDAMMVDIQVVAMSDGGDCGGWHFTGIAFRPEGGNVTVNFASLSSMPGATGGVAVDADTSNQALRVTATGASANYRWVARVFGTYTEFP